MKTETEISIVVPLYNEASNLPELFSELDEAMMAHGKPYEVIFVNDGSTDDSRKVLEDLAKKKECVHVLSLKNNVGKAGALEQGFRMVAGDRVVIMDCDLQYHPGDIPALLDKIEEGYDVVSGKRVNREDSKSVKLTSSLFRLVVRKLSGLNFSDYFSGLKCFRSSVISYLGVYGDLNRIFSVYAYRAGFKVCEIPVAHRARRHGESKYNFLTRLRLAIRDIIYLFFTVVITREGLYKVGLLGFAFLSAGSVMIVTSFFLASYGTLKVLVGNPLTLIGILCVYVGWQLRFIEVIGREFFARHMGSKIFEEDHLRMSNVSYVEPAKRKLFELRRVKRGIYEQDD